MAPPDLMAQTLSRPRRSTTAAALNSRPLIPFSNRRRLMPDQIQALQDLYELKSHPTKEDRSLLADELNLDIKAVNVWYQNKRRSMKKKSLAWTKASLENQLVNAVPSQPQLSRAARTCSLDAIVSSREIRDTPDRTYKHTPSSSSRRPLTTRRPRNIYDQTLAHPEQRAPSPGPSTYSGGRDSEIWEHIPSSPLLPPSSPSDDVARFAGFPQCSKVMRSLEWACAKDRMNIRKRSCLAEEREVLRVLEADVPGLCLDAPEGVDTDAEADEAITPDTSLTMETCPEDGPKHGNAKARHEGEVAEDVPAEDVEAAIALLGFSVHQQP